MSRLVVPEDGPRDTEVRHVVKGNLQAGQMVWLVSVQRGDSRQGCHHISNLRPEDEEEDPCQEYGRAWGQSHQESSRKAQLVEETTDKSEDNVRRLEATEWAEFKCQTCYRPRHTSSVLEKSAQNAMRASNCDILNVQLVAQAPARRPREKSRRRLRY